jgi:5-methyltetrahydrofolate--homocysteine methyltransferase
MEEQDNHADVLDVNVGLPEIDEVAMMCEVVGALQAITDLPLQIDTTDPVAMEKALRMYNGKPMINSVNGKEESVNTILPLVKKYGAAVVGLTLDSRGIPQTAQGRVEIAERILETAQEYGIEKEDLWIDCLTLTVSAQQEQAAQTLRAVREVHERLGLQIVLGVSNISFGLPNRNLITQSFLTQAMHCGLTLPIINPNLTEMMDAVAAFRVLSGEDQGSADFIARFANQPAIAKPKSADGALTLEIPREVDERCCFYQIVAE